VKVRNAAIEPESDTKANATADFSVIQQGINSKQVVSCAVSDITAHSMELAKAGHPRPRPQISCPAPEKPLKPSEDRGMVHVAAPLHDWRAFFWYSAGFHFFYYKGSS